ncbi:MAG: putative spermidine/putrescine transport system permease protein [Chloroflexota bacterium]|nr:putative spermidine/putrescine transport system permease protein [Chloroflexota bacterium]
MRRRALGSLYRHPRAALAILLTPPAGWMGVVYFGSLALLFVAAFWSIDPRTSALVRQFSLDNFHDLLTRPVYRDITLRTVAMATAVTVTSALLAFPIAYYMARVASPRTRHLLVVAVLIPLWSSYVVKVFAWRVILQQNGPLDWFGQQLGTSFLKLGYSDAAGWLVFTYLWLPYMILPLYAGLERIPQSVLEASADLGGRSWMTFRRVILPLALPALVAGSIFTFSLTLGDYITPPLVMNSQFIGNVIYSSQGVAGNIPFAAAFALVPVVVMALYLWLARRAGAFEAL